MGYFFFFQRIIAKYLRRKGERKNERENEVLCVLIKKNAFAAVLSKDVFR